MEDSVNTWKGLAIEQYSHTERILRRYVCHVLVVEQGSYKKENIKENMGRI